MRKWVIRGVVVMLVMSGVLVIIWAVTLRVGHQRLSQELAFGEGQGVEIRLNAGFEFDTSETGTPQILEVVSLYNTLPAPMAETVSHADTADPQELSDAVRASDAVLEQIHLVASENQGFWKEGVTTTPYWMDDLLARTGSPRSVIRLLDAEIIVRQRAGDLGGAGESIAAGLSLSRQIGEHPSFIGALVQVVYESIMLRHVETLYADGGMPPQRVIDRISEVDVRAKIPAILSWEGSSTVRVSDGVIAKPMNVHNAAYSLGQYRRLTEQIEKDDLPLRELKADVDHPWWAWQFAMGAPQIDHFFKEFLKHQAYVDLAEAAIMLRRHKAEYGAYPPTLDELAGLPADPFTGGAFDYRREGDGFVLTSAGDNNGESIDWRWEQ